MFADHLPDGSDVSHVLQCGAHIAWKGSEVATHAVGSLLSTVNGIVIYWQYGLIQTHPVPDENSWMEVKPQSVVSDADIAKGWASEVEPKIEVVQDSIECNSFSPVSQNLQEPYIGAPVDSVGYPTVPSNQTLPSESSETHAKWWAQSVGALGEMLNL